MGIIKDLLIQELINLDCEASSQKDFFNQVTDVLEQKGYIESSFNQAIQTREEEYPTGLRLNNIEIAIPHTDPIHVKRPFICLNKISNGKISFEQMGSLSGEKVDPEYVLVLGISKPNEQVQLLAELMDLFNNRDFVEDLRNCSSSKEVTKLFN